MSPAPPRLDKVVLCLRFLDDPHASPRRSWPPLGRFTGRRLPQDSRCFTWLKRRSVGILWRYGGEGCCSGLCVRAPRGDCPYRQVLVEWAPAGGGVERAMAASATASAFVSRAVGDGGGGVARVARVVLVLGPRSILVQAGAVDDEGVQLTIEGGHVQHAMGCRRGDSIRIA